jgi:beta-lactamase class A
MLADTFGGRIGIAAKNLNTDDTLFVNAREKFPTASAIKLPIMVEYFHQLAEGKISGEQIAALTDSGKWGGTGILQYFSGSSPIKLADAVMLMITLSDNSATNLVIDALGTNHEEKLAAVNDRMLRHGLQNTRVLNKVMSWKTKKNSPESLRYGIGVSTPKDMVLLLEKMWRGELVSSAASKEMVNILGHQQYNSMIPRLLPFESTDSLVVAHKTGSVTGVRVDVGLVLSNRASFAIAIFCDEVRDQRDSEENLAEIAGAQAARLIWNHWTGDTGLDRKNVERVDWHAFPAGEWAKMYLRSSPFPDSSRAQGHTYEGKFYPKHPHYDDSSAVVVMLNGYHQINGANDLIVHFHGWNNDNLGAMEQFSMVQQLIDSKKNAILVFAQGPYRAADSHGGKMEREGGLKKFVEEILQGLIDEKRLPNAEIGRMIITAHSGGYRPALSAISDGQLSDKTREVFLFDAFYAQYEKLLPWLSARKDNKLRSIYTEHLAGEHKEFMGMLRKQKLAFSDKLSARTKIYLTPSAVCHNCVIDGTFEEWLRGSCLEDVEQSK